MGNFHFVVTLLTVFICYATQLVYLSDWIDRPSVKLSAFSSSRFLLDFISHSR